MTKDEEIYAIRFNKVATKDDLRVTTYTLEIPTFTPKGFVTPIRITLAGSRITILFNDNTKHIISYTEDVELLIRPKEKQDGRDTQADTNERTVR